jgi:parallel beta-helix repeat protein
MQRSTASYAASIASRAVLAVQPSCVRCPTRAFSTTPPLAAALQQAMRFCGGYSSVSAARKTEHDDHHHGHTIKRNGSNGSSNANGSYAAASSSGGSSNQAAAPTRPTDAVSVLQKEVRSLREEVRQRDAVIVDLKQRIDQLESAAAAKPPSAAADAAQPNKVAAAPATPCAQRTEEYPCNAVVVRTSTEMLAALEKRVSDITLPRGAVIHIPYGASVSGYQLTIHGPAGVPEAEKPVIECFWNVKGPKSSLTVTHCVLSAPDPTEPCISVATNASTVVTNCTITGGRDGVYLAGSSTAVLTKCRVTNNTRGVMETLRCRADLRDCHFEDNKFHCVLLSPPSDAATARAVRATRDIPQHGNTFAGGRCDVALTHNPIQDSYGDTYKGGHCLRLSETDSTAGLVDAAW